MNRCSRRVDVCNSEFQRILLLRAIVVAAAVVVGGAAAAAITVDRGLLGKHRACREVATPQRTLYASASSD